MSTNHRAFRCLLLATCFFLGTSATKSAHNADNDDDYIPYIDSGLKDDFDWLLLKHLNTPAFSNVIVSPISLKIALALLYEGSGGNTEAELRTLLRFDANKTVVNAEFGRVLSALQENPKLGCDGNVAGPSRREYSLNLGTRIFMDYRIQPTTTFQSKACEVYRTKIEASNFTNSEKTSADINAWVSRLTSGKIAKLVDAKDVEESVMVVLNAIHFKGLWNLQFPKNQSHRGGFYLGPNQVAQVDYMATSGNYFFIESKELDAKLIRIPYQGKKYAMIIGLPNSKAGLASLIQRLNVSTLKNVLNIMDKQTVDLILPKFKFDFGIHLADTLKNMGVKSLFENTVSLPGISRGNNEIKPQVSEIIQKSGIEVNEDGSEAYAATIIQLTNKFGEAQSEFNATHPFMFYIEDQTTHTILFIGKVENPLESSVPVPSRFGQVQCKFQGFFLIDNFVSSR